MSKKVSRRKQITKWVPGHGEMPQLNPPEWLSQEWVETWHQIVSRASMVGDRSPQLPPRKLTPKAIREVATYRLRDAMGVCVYCGAARDIEGSKGCSVCRAKRKAWNARNLKALCRNYKNNSERKAAIGLCTACTAPTSNGRRLCPRHIRQRVQVRRARRKELASQGLCVDCRQPRGDNPNSQRWCRKCQDRVRAYQKAWRDRRAAKDKNGGQ